MSGKRLAAARAQVDRERLYQPVEALRLLKSLDTAKFDETVEVHFRLGLNVRHAEEQLRGTIMLPHGTGSDMRVAVFAQGEKAAEAEAAGADIVGGDDLAQRILDGFDEFDVTVATPDMMVTVGKLGRVLGPSGKMPNPKTGTVTMDVKKAIEEIVRAYILKNPEIIREAVEALQAKEQQSAEERRVAEARQEAACRPTGVGAQPFPRFPHSV